MARALRIVAAVLSALLLVGSGWVYYLRGTAEANLTRTDALPASGNSAVDGMDGGALNLLLVGSDSRAGATDQQLTEDLRTGADPGMNTDTMLVVHVPSDGSSASIVSLPRDSYVDIPGAGKGKLNSAYADGYYSLAEGATVTERDAAAAQLLVQTVSALTGLHIDHYAQVDLLGFFDLSNVIGGVEVNLCAAVQEPLSGVDLPAGVQTISGADALAFVRQRHGLPNGDLDRIVRQQVFLGGVVRKLISEDVLLNPFKQKDLVTAASKSLTVDSGLNLLDVAERLQNVAAGDVRFQTVPVVNPAATADGASIVELADPETLHAFFASLSTPPSAPDTSTVSPGDVTVAVFNGAGVAGLGGDTRTALADLGFTVASVGNADSNDYATTEIRYAAGAGAQARTLAGVVPGATLVPTEGVTGVQLVLGRDFAGIGQPPSPSGQPADATTAATGSDARTAADTACIN